MSTEKQSAVSWWARRLLIVLPPWALAFILMAMGAGGWAYVVGIGGTLLLGGIEIAIDYMQRRRQMIQVKNRDALRSNNIQSQDRP